MKRLIKKAEVDLSKYKGKFVEEDAYTESPTQDGRGNAQLPVCASFRLMKTDESDEQWAEVKQAFGTFHNEDQAAEYIGKDKILEALNGCAELDQPIEWSEIAGLYSYMDSNEYFEFTFEADIYTDDDNDDEFRR